MAKKKANPQSEDNKPPKTQHQTMDDAASEKLHSLKSLNAMLLKETVERRQQVDSLTQVNVSLESDLNRYKSDKVSLQSELNGVTERSVMLEIEAELVSMLVAVQVNQMAEVNRIERAAMEEEICALERDINRVLEEKNGIERMKNKKESEIGSLNSRLKTLVAEIGEEKFVLSQKWSKGKQKKKVNNMVLFDKATYDKLLSEAPKFKLITPSILSDRLRVL